MSLYAVKNDKGEWLGWEIYQDDPEFISNGGSVWTDLDKAKFHAKANGGHVVELVDAQEKITVSEAEAKMLERAKDSGFWASGLINAYVRDDVIEIASSERSALEDRLMRAYVIGWTVEKPKRWYVKVPKKWSGDDKHYWTKEQDGSLTWVYLISKDYRMSTQQFTAAEIDQYGLQDCEKEECKQDEEK